MSEYVMVPVGPFKPFDHSDLRAGVGLEAFRVVRELDRMNGYLSGSFREYDAEEAADAILAKVAALSTPAPSQGAGIGREEVRVDDLAMLIRMLVRHVPETKQIRGKALGYLSRHDLMGSPLREDDLALLEPRP